MGLQKALGSDGWINPDAKPSALHRQTCGNGAGLVLNLYLGREGTQPWGYPEADPPIWGPPLCSLPCVGFCCCWLLHSQDRQPLLCPQATPLLLLCCFRDQEGTRLFSWSRGGRKDPADLQLCCSLSLLPAAFLAKPRCLLPALGDPLTDIWAGERPHRCWRGGGTSPWCSRWGYLGPVAWSEVQRGLGVGGMCRPADLSSVVGRKISGVLDLQEK